MPENPGLLKRLSTAMMDGLGLPSGAPARKKADRATTRAAETRTLNELGLLEAHRKADRETLESFVKKLEESQAPFLEELSKIWLQLIYYVEGEQYLAYHRDRRTWIPRRTLPWRIRSSYNVMQKAVNIRVNRLCENKPTVTVQARTPARDDVEKAEYKESLFYYLWDKLRLLEKFQRARGWAARGGSAFFETGWDPDAGVMIPATIKRRVTEDVMVPQLGPDGNPIIDPRTGQPAGQLEPTDMGIKEFYVDEDGKELGPVEVEEEDPATGEKKLRRKEPPLETAFTAPGEAFVDVHWSFSILFDRYVDDIADSWYVQKRLVMPASKILGTYGKKALEALKDAQRAGENDRALMWTGLRSKTSAVAGRGSTFDKAVQGEGSKVDLELDADYKVVETLIFPKNGRLRALWGEKGTKIVTVGDRLLSVDDLPKWAAERMPFIQLGELESPGNHYRKPLLQDLIALQDDLNRTLSLEHERAAMTSRLLLWAPQNHGMKLSVLGAMSGVLVTTRSREHKPEAIEFGRGAPELTNLRQTALEGASYIGDMNDASVGKLPSAGLAAKTVYALQYADERSVTEVSNAQDLTLKRLAEALDAITRAEYTEPRKIAIVGADRSYLVEKEIRPENLDVDVDYTFQPGSMLARNKEAVKNELLALLDAGLVDPATVRKTLPTGVPDVFRTSYDLQEAAARRMLSDILSKDEPAPPMAQPWHDPQIFSGVMQECLLTRKYELANTKQQQVIAQMFQVYVAMMQGQAAPTAPGSTPPGTPAGAPGQPPASLPPGAMTPQSPTPNSAQGAQQLEKEAQGAVQPPDHPPGAKT